MNVFKSPHKEYHSLLKSPHKEYHSSLKSPHKEYHSSLKSPHKEHHSSLKCGFLFLRFLMLYSKYLSKTKSILPTPSEQGWTTLISSSSQYSLNVFDVLGRYILTNTVPSITFVCPLSFSYCGTNSTIA